MSEIEGLNDDPTNGTETFRCWCGESGPYDKMCDDTVYDQNCGGTGQLECECGGDICSCHNHGSVECPGCPDCGDEGDDDYDYADSDGEGEPEL